ncbi:MAG: hypothetical protein M0D54_04450 [Hyphomonadaceae bacterium JAD_PAG50586_4]|nr:MAG: hypothetical protein M0D54_04450 [Hyphomonadaceae bacterium JAD_PAG50586_4]
MLASLETYHRHRDPGSRAARGGAEVFVRALRRTKLLDVCQRIEVLLHAPDQYGALLEAEDALRATWGESMPRCEVIWTRGRDASGQTRMSFAAYDHSGAALLRTSCTLPSVELSLSA